MPKKNFLNAGREARAFATPRKRTSGATRSPLHDALCTSVSLAALSKRRLQLLGSSTQP
ncbi:hypothetical protein HMPREF3192_01428 [Atopobium deltae]|uniref:Uncharacterized protein n=1 Tax=Atopobium deltae TaxID=1393034 RepID=A0A133XQ41_9ACTN|nr:hypothetical protein HMPREF3192_01428 [Atopobium deltae]